MPKKGYYYYEDENGLWGIKMLWDSDEIAEYKEKYKNVRRATPEEIRMYEDDCQEAYEENTTSLGYNWW